MRHALDQHEFGIRNRSGGRSSAAWIAQPVIETVNDKRGRGHETQFRGQVAARDRSDALSRYGGVIITAIPCSAGRGRNLFWRGLIGLRSDERRDAQGARDELFARRNRRAAKNGGAYIRMALPHGYVTGARHH